MREGHLWLVIKGRFLLVFAVRRGPTAYRHSFGFFTTSDRRNLGEGAGMVLVDSGIGYDVLNPFALEGDSSTMLPIQIVVGLQDLELHSNIFRVLIHFPPHRHLHVFRRIWQISINYAFTLLFWHLFFRCCYKIGLKRFSIHYEVHVSFNRTFFPNILKLEWFLYAKSLPIYIRLFVEGRDGFDGDTILYWVLFLSFLRVLFVLFAIEVFLALIIMGGHGQ